MGYRIQSAPSQTARNSAATVMYYYGYRYYEPGTGRWVSRDPIGERGGLNLFAFVGNDCVSKLDLLGNAVFVLSVFKDPEDSVLKSGALNVDEYKQAILDHARDVENIVSHDDFALLQSLNKVTINNKPFTAKDGDKAKYLEIVRREAELSRHENISVGGINAVKPKVLQYEGLATRDYDVLAFVGHGLYSYDQTIKHHFTTMGKVDVAGDYIDYKDIVVLENQVGKSWILQICLFHDPLRAEYGHVVEAKGKIIWGNRIATQGDKRVETKCLEKIKFTTFGYKRYIADDVFIPEEDTE